MIYKVLKLIVFCFAFSIVFATKANASKLYMNAESTTIQSGQITDVVVMVDTEGADINALTSDIVYSSTNMTVSDLSHTNSVFPNSVEGDISTGTIRISRFSNGGTSFKGIGEIARFRVTPSITGNLTLQFSNNSVVVNTSSVDTLTDSQVLSLTVTSQGTATPAPTLPQTAEPSLGVIIASLILILSISHYGVIKYTGSRFPGQT